MYCQWVIKVELKLNKAIKQEINNCRHSALSSDVPREQKIF